MAGWRVRSVGACLALAASGIAAACGSEAGTGPEDRVERLEFESDALDLGDGPDDLADTVTLRNTGTVTIGPVELVGGPVRRAGGVEIPGARVVVTPSEIPTLAPGQSRDVSLAVLLPPCIEFATYESSVQAVSPGLPPVTLVLGFTIRVPPGPDVASLELATGPASPRQGDVVAYEAVARDAGGGVLPDATLAWSIAPADAGLITCDGRFVGFVPGTATLTVAAGAVTAVKEIEVTPRGVDGGTFAFVGHGSQTARFTSDLWVRGDAAYTGTWGQRTESGTPLAGNRLYAWDISNPAAPLLTDSVAVDARTVNDVKIREDGNLAVLTHEMSNDGKNGITLLDLADPHHPEVITRFTPPDLTPGIHNVWIDGDFVYAVVDGIAATSGLRVIDVADPAAPTIAAGYYAGSSFLHDVYVRDGLAFLSHWDAGLVILDVGNGMAGGTPHDPREVGRVRTAGGQTHNAWYWPEGEYVFVGEEDFNAPPGIMHVVDVSDLRSPREVATFRVPGETPHNFWLDEERGILYLAWYRNGIRALDVSGELLGELDRQGREIASEQYGSGSFCFGGAGTCTWAPQLQDGIVWVSDLNTGIWALRPGF